METEHRYDVFIVTFEQILHIVLVFLLPTLNKSMTTRAPLLTGLNF